MHKFCDLVNCIEQLALYMIKYNIVHDSGYFLLKEREAIIALFLIDLE